MGDMHQNQPVPSPGPSTATPMGTNTPNGRIIASASRADGNVATSDEIANYSCKGVRLFVNVTDDGVAGTATVKIQVRDPLSDVWFDLPGATTAALTEAGGGGTLTVYPGLTETANIDVSSHLGSAWRVVATVAGGNAVTYSVGGDYLL